MTDCECFVVLLVIVLQYVRHRLPTLQAFTFTVNYLCEHTGWLPGAILVSVLELQLLACS